MSNDLLDAPSVDRFALAAGRATDPELGGLLNEARVAWNRALWSRAPDEFADQRARGLERLDRARECARRDRVWRSTPESGVLFDGVRSFSGSIGVHYATLDGRPVVVKASRELDGELAAAELATRVGLATPRLERVAAEELGELPPALAGREVLLVGERVDGFDVRHAPLVGWSLGAGEAEELGGIAAFDVLVGNWDRFASGNTGNLMIAGGRLVLIDTEASFAADPREVYRRFREPSIFRTEIEAYFGVRLDPDAVGAGARAMVDRMRAALRELENREPFGRMRLVLEATVRS